MSGPLKGTQFLPGGQTTPFTYGSLLSTSTMVGGSGADTVNGFVAGGVTDKIDLTGFANLHTLSDVLALASQVGANTVINFGAGDTLTLNGVTRTSLTANDFVFASWSGEFRVHISF